MSSEQAVPPRASIFLSYAPTDRPAARTIRDALAKAGLEVWLDEEELTGGDAWDAKIKQQIRTCTYFMPIISAATESRREGYFRREWRLAVEQQNVAKLAGRVRAHPFPVFPPFPEKGHRERFVYNLVVWANDPAPPK